MNMSVWVTETLHLTLLPVTTTSGVKVFLVSPPPIAEPLCSHWYLTDVTFQPVVLRYEQVNGEPAAAVPETLAVSTGPMPDPIREMRPVNQ